MNIYFGTKKNPFSNKTECRGQINKSFCFENSKLFWGSVMENASSPLQFWFSFEQALALGRCVLLLWAAQSFIFVFGCNDEHLEMRVSPSTKQQGIWLNQWFKWFFFFLCQRLFTLLVFLQGFLYFLILILFRHLVICKSLWETIEGMT